MFRNALLCIVQVTASTCSGRVHYPMWGSNALFPNDFGKDLFTVQRNQRRLRLEVQNPVQQSYEGRKDSTEPELLAFLA